MDDRSFDHFARIAAGHSRRDHIAVAGALFAAVFIRSSANANLRAGNTRVNKVRQLGGKSPAKLRLGAPCEVNEQCTIDHADGMPAFHDRDLMPICGNNGMDKDGAGNCCKPASEFAFCRRDQDCCDDAVCVGIKQLGTICSRTDQRDLGMSCIQTADCYGQTAGFNMLCDANGAGQHVCCVNGGGVLECHEDGHCCGTALCAKAPGEESGFCVDSVDGGLPLGAACTADGLPCSQTRGATACADNGDWYDLATNCCRADDGLCRQDHDCCAGFVCLDGACAAGGGTEKRWGDIGGVQPPQPQ